MLIRRLSLPEYLLCGDDDLDIVVIILFGRRGPAMHHC